MQLLDTDITTRLYLDRNEPIRIRVERDEFYDNEPGPRKADSTAGSAALQEERVDIEADRKAPYTITVSGLAPHFITFLVNFYGVTSKSSIYSPTLFGGILLSSPFHVRKLELKYI